MRQFFHQIPSLYEQKGIKLLNSSGAVKVGKEYHVWKPLVSQCAVFFETIENTDRKGHSKAVYYRIAKFIPGESKNGKNPAHLELMTFLRQVVHFVPPNLMAD